MRALKSYVFRKGLNEEHTERLTYYVLLHHSGTPCLADKKGFFFFLNKTWRDKSSVDFTGRIGKAKKYKFNFRRLNKNIINVNKISENKMM